MVEDARSLETERSMKRPPVNNNNNGATNGLRRGLSAAIAVVVIANQSLVATPAFAHEVTTPTPATSHAAALAPGAFFFGCILAVLIGVIVLIISAIRANKRRS